MTDGVNYYRCVVAHTSGTLATDITSGYWAVTGGATDLAYEIPTPYLEADLFDLDVDTQSADTLYIFHHSYQPASLLRLSASFFVLVNPKYIGTSNISRITTIAKPIENIATPSFATVHVMKHKLNVGQRVYLSGITGVPNFNNKIFTALWFGVVTYAPYDPSASYTAASPVILVGNWAEFDFGGGRSLYIACPYGSWDGTQAIITVATNTTDTLSVTLFNNHITILLANTTAAKNSASLIQTAIQALALNNKVLDLGGLDDATYQWTVTENSAYTASRPTSNFGTIVQFMSNEENAYNPLQNATGIFPPSDTSYFAVNTTPMPAASYFNLAGTGGIYSAYVSGGIMTPLVYLFNDAGDYPSCGSLYQQRLVMAGSDNEADKLYGSTQGDYPNFICDPNSEDYSIQFSLVSPKVDPILNAIGSPNGLLLGTASGAWIGQ